MLALSDGAKLSTLAPFRIRNYRFQWPADLATSWAFEMETLILGWYVLVQTGSVLMLTVFGSPTWRTVTGGSARYVEKIAAGLDEVLVHTPVHHVERTGDGVRVVAGDGDARAFDAAVIATHPRHALAMLARPTTLEQQVLGAMPYSVNHAQLHTDTSLLPRAERARASWNYLIPRDGDGSGSVVVTYDMTRLMRISTVTDRRFLVTLGGADRVDPEKVIAEMTYEHPLYTPESVATQQRLAELGSHTLAFAGAYHGWGFHEDGARSGVEAARRLGVEWDSAPTKFPHAEAEVLAPRPPRRSTGPGSGTPATPRSGTASNTAATAGSSTSTTSPGSRCGCGPSRVSTPPTISTIRSRGRHCATPSTPTSRSTASTCAAGG